MDETKFTAAVFRRGSKPELFDGEANGGNGPTGYEKLEELYKIWKLKRSGRELAAAIWRPEKCAAEVVLRKGKLLSYIGTQWGSKLYLCIEEAVYMVDRASLLLFIEEGPKKKKRLLSLKDCYSLIADSGVSMGQFLVYCKLMRAGFVAHRNGIPWVEKYSEVLRKRGFRLAADGGINDGLTERTGEKSAAAYSMRKKRKRKACGGEESRSWWPEYTYFSAEEESKVPRCVIVTQDMLIESRLQEFPNLRPIRMYSESDLENDSKDISGHDLLYLDVYPPNSNFSRKNSGEKKFTISVAAEDTTSPPSEKVIYQCVKLASGTPVRVAGIDHGDITFYSFVKTQLRDIH